MKYTWASISASRRRWYCVRSENRCSAIILRSCSVNTVPYLYQAQTMLQYYYMYASTNILINSHLHLWVILTAYNIYRCYVFINSKNRRLPASCVPQGGTICFPSPRGLSQTQAYTAIPQMRLVQHTVHMPAMPVYSPAYSYSRNQPSGWLDLGGWDSLPPCRLIAVPQLDWLRPKRAKTKLDSQNT